MKKKAMYKLINKTTGEEHLCDKVVVDGFDYYVNDGGVGDEYYYHINLKQILHSNNRHIDYLASKKIIATNNPDVALPGVVDEVKELANKTIYVDGIIPTSNIWGQCKGFVLGYNKSQETHPFTEEDMIEFTEWCSEKAGRVENKENTWHYHETLQQAEYKTTKELFQIWKEQRVKTLYYN
jgi:hypothetical protein